MENLAIVLKNKGECSESEMILRETVQSRQLCKGREHLETTHSQSLLGSVLCLQNKYLEAYTILEEVFMIQLRVVGPEHPETLNTQGCISEVQYRLGKYQEAEILLRSLLQKSQKVLGRHHGTTLERTGWLMEVLEVQERFAEAEMLGTKALTDFENMGGSSDIDITSIEFAMGRTYHRLLDAVLMLERALRGFTGVYGVYGTQHPATKVVFSEYMSVVQKIQQSQTVEHTSA
jgi:hypothetical protein